MITLGVNTHQNESCKNNNVVKDIMWGCRWFRDLACITIRVRVRVRVGVGVRVKDKDFVVGLRLRVTI